MYKFKRKIKDFYHKITWTPQYFKFKRYYLIVWYFITKPYWKYKHKHFVPNTIKDWRKKTDYYIKSIGGLKNGYFGDSRPNLYSSWSVSASTGWNKLIYELVVDIVNMGWSRHVCQVKEKFGGLRFYIGSANQQIFDRINKAECDSFEICEICGKEGHLCSNGGWLQTCCVEHMPDNYEILKDDEDEE